MKAKKNVISGSFFYLLSLIFIYAELDHVIYYQTQLPVFVYSYSYLKGFLIYAGGFSEYLTSFITQFFVFRWAGAILLSILIYFSAVLTKMILKQLAPPKSWHLLNLIPAFIFLALLCNHRFKPYFLFSFLLVLTAFYLYIRIQRSSSIINLSVFVFTETLLYYFSGGIFLYYALLVLFYELIFPIRRTAYFTILGLLIFTLAIPYLFTRYLFFYTLKEAFFNHTGFSNSTISISLLIVLYLFFPFILLFYSRSSRNNKNAKTNHSLRKLFIRYKFKTDSTILIFAQTILFFILAFPALFLYIDKNEKNLLKFNQLAQNHRWNAILERAKKKPINSRIISFQVNRALYFTGKLTEEMFEFPQHFGIDGLFPDKYDDNSTLMQSSDLYFDLGYINESQHWAFEAIVYYGETPEILKRHAMLNIIKGDNKAAKKYLIILSKTLFYKNWALLWLQKIQSANKISNDKIITDKRLCMPDKDFFSDRNRPFLILKFLLDKNKRNKMAFEYLMSYYLLSHQYEAFLSNLYRMNEFSYNKLPKVYQEAIIVIKDVLQKSDKELSEHKIDPVINDQFIYYKTILFNSYHGNLLKAQPVLKKKFGQTYWYYLHYDSPITNEIMKEKISGKTTK
jgi:hypothetical protein